MSDTDNTSPAPEGAGTPNPTSKMARRRARELALQGVYQWLLSANTMITVQRHLESETENLDKIDRELFVSLLRGAIEVGVDLVDAVVAGALAGVFGLVALHAVLFDSVSSCRRSR